MDKINYAFIDSQNLYRGVKSHCWTLNFSRFRIYLKDKFNIHQAYLFIGFVKEYQSLYQSLKKAGFNLIFKPTYKIRKNGQTQIKGNVDAELVLHSLINYQQYHKAVLVTGDGDFYCLAHHLAGNNKLVKILIPNRHAYSRLYSDLYPYLEFITPLKEKLKKEV